MGQALYRKYRSMSFDEVVGQEHITKTLRNALKSGRISHAYLFTGPRGVGKTSVARILAHEINSLEYKDESVHLDIIEIDAASNRRIDEIRDLRDKVRVAPAAAKYKVYIIDEVHMLTREAFNALLKTLEEPPAHCIFILATTEAHKLPETIISRTQRFEFKPIEKAQAVAHLQDLAKKEKIDIEPAALELLAEFGGGSFRDSIGYLDQLSSYSRTISEKDVRSLLGLPAASEITQLLALLDEGDQAGLLSKLRDIQVQGVNANAVAASLSSNLRSIATKSGLSKNQIELLKELMNVSASNRPQEALEIALLEATEPSTEPKPAVIKQKAEPVEKPDKPKTAAAAIEPAIAPVSVNFDLGLWEDIVNRSKDEAASIYTALRLAKPDFTDGVLTLRFQFPLHQKKLSQAKNKELVGKVIEGVCGQNIPIEVVVDKNLQKDEAKPEPAKSEPVGVISNIFGGAEVMES
ncbi:MAG TPA: DNA polymerase III subunit gamma/tau [Candidatus Saccharimonadales bacterium]|nr:DNA polymerase III subunit gamma/tau [Candidatus Saccharimonadales bacterium]